jgi:hypothetical protein
MQGSYVRNGDQDLFIRLVRNSYSPLIQFGLRWHHRGGLSLWYRNCSNVLEHLGSGE